MLIATAYIRRNAYRPPSVLHQPHQLGVYKRGSPAVKRSSLKRIVVVALMASVMPACRPAWAQSATDFGAIDAQLKACSDKNPGNPGVSNCTANANAAANRRLKEIYTAALNSLNHPGLNSAPYNPEIPMRLILAERGWIAFRNAECNYKSMIAHGGTGEGYVYVACL